VFKKKRKPISFEINSVKVNHKTDELVNFSEKIQNEINKMAQNHLYAWDKVPIELPESRINLDLSENKKNELLKIPTADELEELAFDSQHKRIKLNKTQLKQIRAKGEFEVESKNFPGKAHKWRLAKWLQKGSESSNGSFYSNIATALFLIIVVAKRRFFESKKFSILNGLKKWYSGFKKLIDLYIGLPHLKVIPYENELNKMKIDYLIKDLKVIESDKTVYKLSASESIHRIIKSETNNYLTPKNRDNIKVPYIFETPHKLKIDLRLFNHETTKSIDGILTKILETDSKRVTKLNLLRTRLINEYKKDSNLSRTQIIEQTSDRLMEEYEKLIFDEIISDETLESISPGLGQLLVNEAMANIISLGIENDNNKQFNQHIDQFKENLKENYKVRSRISSWLSDAIDEESRRFKRDNKDSIYKSVLNKYNEKELYQWAYFLEKENQFENEHKHDLVEKFKKLKKPVREFEFNRRIWLPKNYIVEELAKPASPVYKYKLNKKVVYKSSTRYPFWRWRNFAIRTWVYLSNAFYFLGVIKLD
jgi:hypothetical protein